MLRFIYACNLYKHGALATSMFEDRKRQFHDRLKWDVSVDKFGQERDQYDALNPLYVIWQREDGLHGGSIRLLPTQGPCMFNQYFTHLTDGRTIEEAQVWECSRFCLSQGAGRHVSASLLLGGGVVMQAYDIATYLGVFDYRMPRIYRRMGVSPSVIGTCGNGRTQISVGKWSYSPDAIKLVAKCSGLTIAQASTWFNSCVL